MSWTDEETTRLRALAATARSAAQIAAHFPGKSRNAVIGKLARIGLKSKGQAYWPVYWNPQRDALLVQLTVDGYTQTAAAEQIGCTKMAARDRLARLRAKSKAPPADTSTRYRAPTVRFGKGPAPNVPALKPAPARKCGAVDANPRRLKFLDLQHGHCRFILEEGDAVPTLDTLYCGADTVEEGSWCEPHRRVVFQAR